MGKKGVLAVAVGALATIKSGFDAIGGLQRIITGASSLGGWRSVTLGTLVDVLKDVVGPLVMAAFVVWTTYSTVALNRRLNVVETNLKDAPRSTDLERRVTKLEETA